MSSPASSSNEVTFNSLISALMSKHDEATQQAQSGPTPMDDFFIKNGFELITDSPVYFQKFVEELIGKNETTCDAIMKSYLTYLDNDLANKKTPPIPFLAGLSKLASKIEMAHYTGALSNALDYPSTGMPTDLIKVMASYSISRQIQDHQATKQLAIDGEMEKFKNEMEGLGVVFDADSDEEPDIGKYDAPPSNDGSKKRKRK